MTSGLKEAGMGSLSSLPEVVQETVLQSVPQLCTSSANADPSCVGWVIQEHCSSGAFTATV